MTIYEKRVAGEALTAEEEVLFNACCTFIAPALQRHGVGLSSNEIPWIGAEVADFVISHKPVLEPVLAPGAEEQI